MGTPTNTATNPNPPTSTPTHQHLPSPTSTHLHLHPPPPTAAHRSLPLTTAAGNCQTTPPERGGFLVRICRVWLRPAVSRWSAADLSSAAAAAATAAAAHRNTEDTEKQRTQRMDKQRYYVHNSHTKTNKCKTKASKNQSINSCSHPQA